MNDFEKTYYQEQLNSIFLIADSKRILYNPKLHFSYSLTAAGCIAMYCNFDESNPVLNAALGLSSILTLAQSVKFIADKVTIKYANKKIDKIEDLIIENNIPLTEDGGVIYKEDGSIAYVDKDEKEYDITKFVEEVIPGPVSLKNKKKK